MEVSGKMSDISDISEIEATEELEKLCELCEVDNANTIANGLCRECEEYMCSTCFRHHLKGKLYRQHVLVDTDQSLSLVQRSAENVEKCKHHANEKIRYYCRKHEVVGCCDCMIPEHSICQPENIKDLSKGFHQNEDFKRLMTKLETIMSAIKEKEKKVQESQIENKNMLEKALEEIKAFRMEMNNYLDRAEASVIKEAKNIQQENDKLLAKLAQECTQLSSKIMEVRQQLDTEMYQDSALFIQIVACKQPVLDIEQEVSRIQKENDIRTFEFTPDKQLHCTISAVAKLGSITKPACKSSTKPDTATTPKTVSNKDAADGKKHTNKKEKELRPITGAAVGARVRPVGKCLEVGDWMHKGQPGTVTAIKRNGTVGVQFDATGQTLYGFGIGEDVELL